MSEAVSVEVPLEAKSELVDKTLEKELKSEEPAREKETVASKHDPYAYIVNNGFTSEKFKIEIRGLPRYYGIGEMKKLINDKLKLNSNKIKSPGPRSKWVYICFRSEEEKQKGIETLNGYRWKGATLQAKMADPAPDPLMKRRMEQDSGPNKKPRLETPQHEEEAIKNSATPLWNVPYQEQLKQKMTSVENLMRRLGAEMVLANNKLKDYVDLQKSLNNGLPCKLHEIRALPEHCDHYRNKCEFSIGRNDLTGERTIGFRLGSYASGSLSIAPVDSLKNFSKEMLRAVHIFQDYVRASDLEVFSAETLQGHWKQLTVRVGLNTGQLMLIVGFTTQDLPQERLAEIKEQLRQFFKSGEGAPLNVTSLYFQKLDRTERGKGSSPAELLLGEPHIEEVLCGLTFKISSVSFFQVNTRCAHLLMESIKEMVPSTQDASLLDICCGTGIIGLCLAKDFKEVLGLELVKEAVEDAKENALKNKIENCQFFCGNAEAIMSSVVSRAQGSHVVAVLDPPRAGLHQKAITLLRKTKNLERIVFVSCDAKSALRNFTDLGRAASKTLSGLPFVPVAVVPIDLFPHTSHYELVMYFERLDIAEARLALPSSVKTQQLVVEKEEPVVVKEEPVVVKEEPVVVKEEPAVVKEETAVENVEPAVEKEQPAVEKEQPAVEKEQPAVEKEQPAVTNEEGTHETVKVDST